jgi:hypothetical protein
LDLLFGITFILKSIHDSKLLLIIIQNIFHTPSDGIAPNIPILLYSSFCLLENKEAAAKSCQHTANGGSHFVFYLVLVADDVGIPSSSEHEMTREWS